MVNLSVFEAGAHSELPDLLGGDTSSLVELLEASCLAELTKLTPDRCDLSSYAQLVVEVLSQFLPVPGVALVVELDDLPQLRVRSGVVGDRAETYPLIGGDGPAGYLSVAVNPDFPDTDRVASSAADVIGSTLVDVARSELSRRRDAAELALRLASAFDENADEHHLQTIAETLGTLPDAVGASIALDLDDGNPPWCVDAGVAEGLVTTAHGDDLEGIGSVELELRWANHPRPETAASVLTIFDTLRDAINRALRYRRLVTAAETDELTGIGNRRMASSALAAALGRARRLGEDVAIAVFDLDFFKRVNDQLGHAAGDEVLRCFAHLLTDQCRADDTVARLGGEEFVVVLPGSDAVGASVVADRIRSLTPQACAAVLPDGWRQTVSVGIASAPSQGDTPEVVLGAADQALYDAKGSGRDAVALASA